jgi:tetratricopeptide (TPR) repeat protein
MINLGIRGAVRTLLSAALFTYIQPSYAQFGGGLSEIGQNARQAGYRAHGEKNYLEAAKQFEIGCNYESADSCAQLGLIFSTQQSGAANGGVDLPKAILYFQRALKIDPTEKTASKSLPFTLGNLAWKRKELSKAAAYWRIACYWKVENSCAWLGDMYREGSGVAQSQLQAVALYNRELILRPNHPIARPNADLVWAAFGQSALGYNAYPEASTPMKKRLREIIQYDSQFWSLGRLNSTSLKEVRIISGVEGSSSYSIRADYFVDDPFGGERKNWMVAEMSGGKVFCLQYGGSSEGCRGMYTAGKNTTARVDVLSFIFSSSGGSSDGPGCELRPAGVNGAGGTEFSMRC